MTDNIARKAVSGLAFRFAERISSQLVSTIVTIVLARILMPEDYGLISLIVIIINICDSMVSHGLGASLIQKKDADQVDFSTTFIGSLFISLVLYALLWLISAPVSVYYNNELLRPILQIMGIRLPIAAVNSIQEAYVSKHLLFKKFFVATLSGTMVSGVVGITMAYIGYGPWALVAQYLTNAVVNTLVLYSVVRWLPSITFSWQRFKGLFSFGWKIMAGGLITAIYEDLRGLLVASKYSTTDLSFYSKGKQFPQLLGGNIGTTIVNVMFPVFSEMQDESLKLQQAVKRSIKMSAFLISPLLLGFAAVSEEFVRVVLTDKWLPCVPFLQIFCLMYVFQPFKHISKSCIRALGKSGLDLTIEIAEKIVGVVLMIISMYYGVLAIALSACLTYMIFSLVYMVANSVLLKYKFHDQLKDIIPSVFLSFGVSIILLLIHFNCSIIILLLLKIIIAIILYVIIAYILQYEQLYYIINFRKKR